MKIDDIDISSLSRKELEAFIQNIRRTHTEEMRNRDGYKPSEYISKSTGGKAYKGMLEKHPPPRVDDVLLEAAVMDRKSSHLLDNSMDDVLLEAVVMDRKSDCLMGKLKDDVLLEAAVMDRKDDKLTKSDKPDNLEPSVHRNLLTIAAKAGPLSPVEFNDTSGLDVLSLKHKRYFYVKETVDMFHSHPTQQRMIENGTFDKLSVKKSNTISELLRNVRKARLLDQQLTSLIERASNAECKLEEANTTINQLRITIVVMSEFVDKLQTLLTNTKNDVTILKEQLEAMQSDNSSTTYEGIKDVVGDYVVWMKDNPPPSSKRAINKYIASFLDYKGYTHQQIGCLLDLKEDSVYRLLK